ncbi:MAG: hypothetical protein QME96_13460 [Myxococcota bacterium]|nr:hypothetical protein [Myxococcota bacterium]
MTYLSVSAPAGMAGEGVYAAAALADAAKTVPISAWTFDGESLHAGGLCVPPALPLDDYPAEPVVERQDGALIRAGDLALALARTVPAVNPDDHRYGLNGVHVERQGDLCRFVATDGSCLHWHDFPAVGLDGVMLPRRMLLPRAGVALLARAVALIPADAEVVLRFGRPDGARVQWTRVEAPGWSLQLCLIDGEFPAYRKVLPETWSSLGFTIEVAALRDAFSRAVAVARDRFHTTCCRVDAVESLLHVEAGGGPDDSGTLAASVPFDGPSSSTWEGLEPGECFTFGVDASLMRAALIACAPAERVTVRFESAAREGGELQAYLSPILLVPGGAPLGEVMEAPTCFIVMPIRLD